MKKILSLALASVLGFGPQTGNASTPWVDGAPDITINLAGAIVVTNAYA